MSQARGRHLALIATGFIFAGVLLAVLAPQLHGRGLVPGLPGKASSRQSQHPRSRSPARDGSGGPSDIELALLVSLTVGMLAGAGVSVALVRRRLLMRHRRDYAVYELKLSMHDQVRGRDLTAMVEGIANAVRVPAGRRARYGQPYLAFEAHYAPGRDREMEWIFCVRCERTLAGSIDALIGAAYPEVRLGYEFAGPPRPVNGTLRTPGHVLRLRKDRHFTVAICSSRQRDGEASSPLEAIAQAQVACARPSSVRIQLTPAITLAERFARSRAHAHQADQRRDGSTAAGSGVAEQQSQAWLFAEIQVAAADRHDAQQIAAALQAPRAANRLRCRHMLLRGNMYRWRFADAYPPLLPSLSTLLAANELAHLIELPGTRMRGVPLRRSALPRMPAPPQVPIITNPYVAQLPPSPADPDVEDVA